jgi:benzoyl-CoA reductase/2-hydroxyglutaryl-CoA dehydratase subunit BcrC/BadD/HgdB
MQTETYLRPSDRDCVEKDSSLARVMGLSNERVSQAGDLLKAIEERLQSVLRQSDPRPLRGEGKTHAVNCSPLIGMIDEHATQLESVNDHLRSLIERIDL